MSVGDPSDMESTALKHLHKIMRHAKGLWRTHEEAYAPYCAARDGRHWVCYLLERTYRRDKWTDCVVSHRCHVRRKHAGGALSLLLCPCPPRNARDSDHLHHDDLHHL